MRELRSSEFQGGHICDWDLHPSLPPPAATTSPPQGPQGPYLSHLEVTAIIFNVDLGYATPWLLSHLHRLDAILHQEKTPNQALLGESNLDRGRGGGVEDGGPQGWLATGYRVKLTTKANSTSFLPLKPC